MVDNEIKHVQRRYFVKGVGGAAAGLIAGCMGDNSTGGSGNGDEFPSDDIELIIPYGSGGYDNYVRLVAPYVEEYLPNDVNVQPQNIEGAGGQIATEQVYNEEPDGYTNMIVNFQAFSLLQVLEDVDYDLEEMTWYAQIGENIGAVGVGTNTEIETFEDYVNAMQNKELKIASESRTGGGTLIPLLLGEVGELYDGRASVDNNVMYDGKGESLQAILAGDAHVMAGSYSSILEFVESGDIRIVLFLTVDDESYDSENAPDADTLATADIANAEAVLNMAASRRHFAGPPEVPDDRAETLRTAFEEAINDDEFLSQAEEAELEIEYNDGESVADGVSNAMEMWKENRDLLEMLIE